MWWYEEYCSDSPLSLTTCRRAPHPRFHIPYWTTAMPSFLWGQRTRPSTGCSMSKTSLPTPPPCEHISPVLFKLHWLPIHQRINYKVLAYQAIHSTSPSYLSELITVSRAPGLLQLHHPSTASLQTGHHGWTFSCATPAIWNDLPTSVRSIFSFKSLLKTHIFHHITYKDFIFFSFFGEAQWVPEMRYKRLIYYYYQEEQIVIINSWVQITARGDTVAHNKVGSRSCKFKSEKILHIVYKRTMPNVELFAINPNRVMMISKCKSNIQPALFYNLGNSL